MESYNLNLELELGIELVYINHLSPCDDLVDDLQDYIKAKVPIGQAVKYLKEDWPELDFQLNEPTPKNPVLSLRILSKITPPSIRFH